MAGDSAEPRTMSVDVLFPTLPTQPGWIFPYLDPEHRSQYRSTDYCSDTITEVNVPALLDTHPWEVLEGANKTISFGADAGGRLGLLIRAYSDFEAIALMAYWETTHSFPILDPAVRRDPWLGIYRKERNNRRSHAGRRWKTIMELLIVAMRERWCDFDILLYPFFVHFTKRVETITWYPGVESRQANLTDPNHNRPEPTALLEALDECNAERVWRNHYQDMPQYHPARQIARIPAMLYDVHAVGDA
ncbi:unnamed protein product [Phytophthora fragariaefolia]|uniref:Unnamed protein product n=1 Tax=Phytophthora fragariaefolia TaxID=1490495 RepID=A0A9W6XB28_9STRA|nr:unnamed protein product [Phytophthora fragariaefolia]